MKDYKVERILPILSTDGTFDGIRFLPNGTQLRCNGSLYNVNLDIIVRIFIHR